MPMTTSIVRTRWNVRRWQLALALVLSSAFALSALRAQPTSEASLAQPAAAVVRFRGETLLQVSAPLGTLQPPERAKAIEQRLAKIAAGSSDALNAIQIVERNNSSDLVVGDLVVLSVTDPDAEPLGRTRQQLAADYEVRLRRALKTEFSGRSLRGITTAVALTLLTTLVLLALIRLITRIFARGATYLLAWRDAHVTAVHVRGLELLSATQLTTIGTQAVATLRWIILGVVGVAYLQTVLSLFPWTRATAIQFRAFIWKALSSLAVSIVDYLPNLVTIALIVLVVRLVLRLSNVVFDALGKNSLRVSGFHPEWAEPSAKIVRFAILALGVVIVFPYLPGSESPAFRSASLFLGVLLSFGSTSAVANVVAGIVMTYMMPFRIGDRVKIGDTTGDVIQANLLVVRVRTIKNVEITIPNAAVLGGHILNYSARARAEGLILHSTVTIGYDVPWRQVHELLITAATSTDGIMATPAPFVLQTSLDDFYVSYQINAFTAAASRMAVIYGELHQHIQDEFAKAGVEIMSPHYRAVRDGGGVTLPSDQLPKGYEAPAFRVTNIPTATP